MRLLSALIIVAALGAASPALTQADAGRGAELIAQTKAAMGGAAWDRIVVWHETGSAGGRPYSHIADFQTLRFHNLHGDSGGALYDGRTLWILHGNNVPTNSNGDAADIRLGAYMVSYGFFFPERFPAQLRFSGHRFERDGEYDVVAITPAGLPSFDVWIDAHKHLVARFVVGDQTTLFSDYRRIEGILVPFVSTVGPMTIRSETINFEQAQPALFEIGG